MGYDSRVTGQIRIDPPLPWPEIRDSDYLPETAWLANRSVKFHVVEETVDTAEGPLLRRTADAIVAVTTDSYSAYFLESNLQELVSRYGRAYTYTGFLDVAGADAGDLSRVYVRDGRAVRVEPRIVWPDEADGGDE